MSDELPTLEGLTFEEPAEEVPVEVENPTPKPIRKPKKAVKRVVFDVVSVPKKIVEKVVEAVSPKAEEPIVVEEVDEGPDYSHFPDDTCWVCRRENQPGADIQIIAGNGYFTFFMCSECQSRFRGARPS
jgi:hypothetical protein